MTANKPETALYRAPAFSLLLVSHGGIVHANNIFIQRYIEKENILGGV